VPVGSLQPVVAHCDERDLIGWTREKDAGGRLRRDQGGRIEPFGLACRDNALCASTGPLDDRLAAEIDGRDLKGRVSKIKAARCPAADFPMQIWSIPASRNSSASSTERTIAMLAATEKCQNENDQSRENPVPRSLAGHLWRQVPGDINACATAAAIGWPVRCSMKSHCPAGLTSRKT
jgi:hypothetical protein